MDGMPNGWPHQPPNDSYAFGNNRPQNQRDPPDILYNPSDIARNEDKSECNDIYLQEIARLSAQLHQQEREEAQNNRQLLPQPSANLNDEFQAQQAAHEASNQPEKRGPGLPYMFMRDQTSSPLNVFHVGKYDILGFNVGGEARLIFGHLRACVFPAVQNYDHYLSKLCITLMEATPFQMEELFKHNSFPKEGGVAKLIRASAAHMLIGQLWVSGVRPLNGIGDLDLRMNQELKQKLENERIKIHCYVFGDHTAYYYPSLFGQHCMECTECGCLMMPPQLAIHSHAAVQASEKLCVWGFQQANWKTFIYIPMGAIPDEDYLEKFYRLQDEGPEVYTRTLVYDRPDDSVSFDPTMAALPDIASQIQYAQELQPDRPAQQEASIPLSTAQSIASSYEAQIQALLSGNQMNQLEISQLQAIIQSLVGHPVVAQQPAVPEPIEHSVQQNYLQQLIAANQHPTHRTNPIQADPDQPGPSGFRMAPRPAKDEVDGPNKSQQD